MVVQLNHIKKKNTMFYRLHCWFLFLVFLKGPTHFFRESEKSYALLSFSPVLALVMDTI